MSEEKKNGIGVAGFVLALIAIFTSWIPIVGWIIWLLGLIFSAVGIAKAKKVKKGMGLSITGLVLSLIGVIVIVALAGTIASMLM